MEESKRVRSDGQDHQLSQTTNNENKITLQEHTGRMKLTRHTTDTVRQRDTHRQTRTEPQKDEQTSTEADTGSEDVVSGSSSLVCERVASILFVKSSSWQAPQ